MSKRTGGERSWLSLPVLQIPVVLRQTVCFRLRKPLNWGFSFFLSNQPIRKTKIMKKGLAILKTAYRKQNEATEALREIYDCGQELTTDQRNELLKAINNQSAAALSLHNVIQTLDK